MNMTKTLLVGVACGALFAGAATVLAPYVHADTQDSEFVKLLSDNGIQANDTGIIWAHQICAHIDNGSTPVIEANKVFGATDLTMDFDKSAAFTASAIVVYCPWNAGTGGAHVA